MIHREEHYVGRRAMRMEIKEDAGNGSTRERQEWRADIREKGLS